MLIVFSYAICIRQEEGYCCIQYQVCNDANSMTLGTRTGVAGANNGIADTDTLCTRDYLRIDGSAATCQQNGVVGGQTDRYCGTFLNTFNTATANIAICDCTTPFRVDIVTDALTENADGTTANIAAERSRGAI